MAYHAEHRREGWTADHGSESERARAADLMGLMPKGRASVLDVGARDGFISGLLTEHFREVTALDLVEPDFEIPGVVTVRGDVTNLDFPDDSFDCVVCTEVLEHVPQLRRAADELARVARHEVIVGVPNQQDLRIGRTTCASCGRTNPPWGHINRFDESILKELFRGLEPVATSYVATTRARTNAVSAWLMERAGHPWGRYDRAEPCIHCGAELVRPAHTSPGRRALASAANRLRWLQSFWVRPRPNWIHMVFRKR